MILLDYRDARPIYTQITEGFRGQILAGILEPGERLPSVRELAGQLAINPNTIQRAYRELESQGLILSVPGKGSFVSDRQPESAEKSALLARLSETAEALTALGMTREQVAQYVMQGGNDNA